MASLKDLPMERRLNTRIRNTDFGIIHRIDGYFDDQPFASAFDLSKPTKDRIALISNTLHYHFIDGEVEQRSELTHEPFYFACAVASLLENRPRIALSKRHEADGKSEIDLSRFGGVVQQYLHHNPNVDGLLEAYGERLSETSMFDQDTDYDPRRIPFPKLFGGLTFFLLECENVIEYEAKKAK